ncbi:unnamed protein product [Protopolystoma xenopodis]|uniref:Uncharacterized protein n=1 Tax=Protopolystoma xenopodis TaxID=117903 RepID=A0A448XSV5_9PLAT|nr:unnamed protein product [Protopolystoma xenopodis]
MKLARSVRHMISGCMWTLLTLVQPLSVQNSDPFLMELKLNLFRKEEF